MMNLLLSRLTVVSFVAKKVISEPPKQTSTTTTGSYIFACREFSIQICHPVESSAITPVEGSATL